MNSNQAGKGQQKEAAISYHSYEDHQPKRSSKRCWNVTPNQRPNNGPHHQQATPPGGKGQQKEATSNYNPYDDRQSKHSSKECWIMTPKSHQPGGKLRQASATKLIIREPPPIVKTIVNQAAYSTNT
ncbi:hypothetical protein NC652_024792 [Populus alba x Populus x berolinensis]|nr:hypothetical protein NC652_024792 [Populus alba x Populus x berolinensis]